MHKRKRLHRETKVRNLDNFVDRMETKGIEDKETLLRMEKLYRLYRKEETVACLLSFRYCEFIYAHLLSI